MDNLDRVVEALCKGIQGLTPSAPSVNFSRTDHNCATVTAEYDHQVFEIRIDAGRRAPRAPLPIDDVLLGTLDDVEVHLTSVVVGPDVTVTLEGQGPEAGRTVHTDRKARAAWEESMQHIPSRPPPWPAERLMELSLELTDNLGTRYAFYSGNAGGRGQEWRYTAGFRPAPPQEATTLTVRAVLDEGPAAVELDLI
ncbi:hypothetical protein [Cellulomonas fimi]|uniref:Uncharacterized protein n=1 Tax=Cellulomonas fimi TaxID=1708 RepID=A0A7Y0M237_CELFI|nr:hypothetical protein [Cellulomonas fimi]NMR21658.1 hypothetical protein [Cellulomonas fimi]